MTREEQIAYLTEWLEDKVLFSNKDREVLTAAKQALQERKEGRWVYKQYGSYPEQGDYHCSECNKINNAVTPYCPFCGSYNGGAKDGDDNE